MSNINILNNSTDNYIEHIAKLTFITWGVYIYKYTDILNL